MSESSAPEVTYQERYCAFIDILGFTQLISDLGRGRARYEDIRSILSRVHDPQPIQLFLFVPGHSSPTINVSKEADFRAQSISDAVALSTKPTRDGFIMLWSALLRLAIELLEQGYFVRGAICKGMLYHDNSMVFGDALVRAYHLESTIACYPRIMVEKRVVDEQLVDPIHMENKFLQADDGPFYIDVLWELDRLLQGRVDKNKEQSERARYLAIKDKLQQRLNESVDNPRHFEKVQWFCQQWNKLLRLHFLTEWRIKGPGLHVEDLA
jgi:hypothetical protein